MDRCKVCLTAARIDIQEALAFVSSPYCGGTSMFMGTTRISENGEKAEKRVMHLTYEAYEDMALATMRQIVEDILGRADDKLHRAYVCHRIGPVALGDSSIFIAVSSPHRVSSHQMVMQILNEIKQKVPIWKKICYDESTNGAVDGEPSHWSQNSEAFWLEKNAA